MITKVAVRVLSLLGLRTGQASWLSDPDLEQARQDRALLEARLELLEQDIRMRRRNDAGQ